MLSVDLPSIASAVPRSIAETTMRPETLTSKQLRLIGIEMMSNRNVVFSHHVFGLAQHPKSWYGKSLRPRQWPTTHMWSFFNTTSHSPHTLETRLGKACQKLVVTCPRRCASDCSGICSLGQQSMSLEFQSTENNSSVVPTWQSLRAWLICIGLFVTFDSQFALAQIHDSLDTHPPRWYLDTSDCEAQVISHGHLADGGREGGACETITLKATHGSEALLVYPIEPVRPVDDLTGNVSVMSARKGARIGFRVRYPYLRDSVTRRPVSMVVFGAGYDSPGEFANIGVGLIEKELQLKNVALRAEHGSTANLKDSYVDGVVINAYSGAGTTALRIDELHISGLIPVGEGIATGNHIGRAETIATARRVGEDSNSLNLTGSPFRPGKITRILQHNGEPLAWVRSLGFDAVLLSQPPNAAILSEAIRARVLIYAPAPSALDPTLQSLLEPVAAWYIGLGDALDRRHLEQTSLESARVRSLPTIWQRPLVGAPSEAWREYAPHLDAIIDDLPPRVRGIRGGEEVAGMNESRRRIGDLIDVGVGIVSMAPDSLVQQSESIANAVGSPPPTGFRWHSMWLQAIRSLESTPSAILYRSTRSLSSGGSVDTVRAMALSYVNRMLAMIEPWVVTAMPSPAPDVVGPYRCSRLANGVTDMLLLSSIATRGSQVLAGDGEVIEILLTPADARKTIWRLTHFSAERLTPEITPTGAKLEIVSPDAAEIIVLSSDPSVGGELSRSAQRFARQASLDRWQLATELVSRTQENWLTATATRASNRPNPTNLINVAQQTLAEAQPRYRVGDTATTLRMAHRADAWAMRSEWQLAEALMPDWPQPVSCPPMDVGAAGVQIFWRPLMDNEGWGTNRLNSGSLDEANFIDKHRWTFGRRLTSRAVSEVSHVTRGAFQGAGALRAAVTPIDDDPLPGGYEGTVIQVQSPSVRVRAGTAIRIDAMVRTLGFGGPHQGVLVYDTMGGQEAGVLVRGTSNWTPVRLYRQTVTETEVHVMFELIGAGEATIDNVQLSLWEPEERMRPTPNFIPMAKTPVSEKDEEQSTNR